MGRLEKGQWVVGKIASNNESGDFEREESKYSHSISKHDERFKPEAGRYHLYVSYACPWANRTLMMRELKSLTDIISMSVVHPHMLENGWTFATDFDGATGDELYGLNYLYQVYQKDDAQASTKVTVPVLWDKKHECIVNNESADILRIFNSAFDELTANKLDFYPASGRTDIDRINERVYHTLNNGVYRAGFATSQEAYSKACQEVFSTLDWLNKLLEGRQFLVGESLTEADIRLLVTLVRFDLVYYSHFKCNIRQIKDYSHLYRWLRAMMGHQELASTVFFDHIKEHYYFSQRDVNPTGIVPLGPVQFL